MINFSELLWKPAGRAREKWAAARNAEAHPTPPDVEIDEIPALTARIGPESRMALLDEPRGIAADRFRQLRIRLREVRELANLRSLLITSPLAQDGKSTVIMNLATTLAEGGKRRVLVVEADLHRPSLSDRLGIDSGQGLAECLRDCLDPLALVHKIEPVEWFLLPSGGPCGNATELLQSDALAGVMERLVPQFEWILVDSPPVLPLTDSVSISKHVDACLMVVRAGRTPEDAIRKGLELIGLKHVLGIVFNASNAVNHSYAKYSTYYRAGQ